MLSIFGYQRSSGANPLLFWYHLLFSAKSQLVPVQCLCQSTPCIDLHLVLIRILYQPTSCSQLVYITGAPILYGLDDFVSFKSNHRFNRDLCMVSVSSSPKTPQKREVETRLTLTITGQNYHDGQTVIKIRGHYCPQSAAITH